MTSHDGSKGAVLLVFPFCLDHVGHGNIQRILGIARYLSSSGFDVDLVYQGSSNVARADGQYATFRRVYGVEAGARSSDEEACARRLAAFYSGHELPAVHLRPSAALTSLVRSLLEAEAYHAVVATYAFTAPIFADLGRRVLTICDVQDIMHEHAGACERATGQKTTFSLPATTEEFLWRQWDVLVAITPDDSARISRDLLPHQHLVVARHAAPLVASMPAVGSDDMALYAASDNVSNVQAAAWLLDRVWPRVIEARPSARLRIAGLICRALPESAQRMPGVEILGFRQDLADEFDDCAVLVAPYLYGSGLKIKVVEAACRGKAIITTPEGVLGTGLQAGRALEVHADSSAFADALAALLGNRGRREAIASTALAQSRILFSAEACYAPITLAIDLLASMTPAPHSRGIAPSTVTRIQVVVDQLGPCRIIIWGNGAYTRALLSALADTTMKAALIADGRATEPRTSPEGLPVTPSADLVPTPDDLIVLSSETFEPEMWRDLTAFRNAGVSVLGLCDTKLISRGLAARLSAATKASLGAESFVGRLSDRPTAIFWDSQATAARWWRLCVLKDLAAAADRRGDPALVVTHASLAGEASALADISAAASIAPILELDGRTLERGTGPDGGHRRLSRLSELMASTTARAAARLTLRAGDTLTLVSPTLTECLGLARTLRALPAGCPSIVIYGLPPTADTSHDLDVPDGDRCAYWRLAVSALSDAAGDQLSIVAHDRHTADSLRALLDFPVGVVPYPAAAANGATGNALPRVVCLGHVGEPCVRPLLESIVEVSPAGISWRSNQSDGRTGTDDRWAPGLASLLGITLLDDLAPSAMRRAITSAQAVVVLNGSTREGWREAASAYASSAGVPVLEPDLSLNGVLWRILNEATR